MLEKNNFFHPLVDFITYTAIFLNRFIIIIYDNFTKLCDKQLELGFLCICIFF